MYAVVYKFHVKDNQEEEFQKAWSNGTKLIYEKLGSLGSRLHFSERNEWIAYALWPSKEIFENTTTKLSFEDQKVISKVRVYCEDIKVLYKMTVADDLIKTVTYI